MAKVLWKPGNMLYPAPVVLVSCGVFGQEQNIITVAWTGTVCSNPPMVTIAVRPERYSYELIQKNQEFVINLTTEKLVRAVDWCGVKSGRKFDKFKEMKLTPLKAEKVNAPLIKESPLSLECRVVESKALGSHTVFTAEVVATQVEDTYFDPQSGVLNLNRSGLIVYSHGQYFVLGKRLGKFGFSVQKKRGKT